MKKLQIFVRSLRQQGPARLFRFLRFRFALAAAKLFVGLTRFNAERDPTKLQLDFFTRSVNLLQNPRILELGSRNISHRDLFKGYSEYIGFDINPGRCVDVVGDLHKLSDYFPPGYFDAVYAISVFEHLAMPWKVVQEINKVLKPNGLLFIFTHPVYPLHAEPWDFWRYSKWTFPVLLNARTGYEILGCAQGLPCVVLPLENSAPVARLHTQFSYMGVAVTARKAGECDSSLDWNLETQEVSGGTYPPGDFGGSEFFAYLKATEGGAAQAQKGS